MEYVLYLWEGSDWKVNFYLPTPRKASIEAIAHLGSIPAVQITKCNCSDKQIVASSFLPPPFPTFIIYVHI